MDGVFRIIGQGKATTMSDARLEQCSEVGAVHGARVVWRPALAVLGAFVWIPVTLYLLLFAPMPLVHDMVHPVRHAFSFVMCH